MTKLPETIDDLIALYKQQYFNAVCMYINGLIDIVVLNYYKNKYESLDKLQ